MSEIHVHLIAGEQELATVTVPEGTTEIYLSVDWKQLAKVLVPLIPDVIRQGYIAAPLKGK